MSEMDHEQRRDELAAFLLGALDPGASAALEQHLAGCEECRAELERLRPVVQALPESVERVEPSPGLRARVMAEVQADVSEARTQEHTARSGRRQGNGWRSILLRPAAGVAAIALIAAGVAAFAIGGGGPDGGAATVVAGKPPGVTVEMISEGESGTLRLANLRELPPEEALQAWVQRGERVQRAGPLFARHRDGTATTTIEDMRGVDTVMVTAEPRGGSAFPTSKPLVSVEVVQ